MRSILATAFALLFGIGRELQLPQASVQELINKSAEASARELGDLARATTLGSLNSDANLAIRKWDGAVRTWKKEKDAGAAPLLAEGVLFDCLGRMLGVKTTWVSDEGPTFNFAALAAKRPARAAKSFDAALKIDPNLTEARFRAARIRALKVPQAVLDLEVLADDPSRSLFSYLAAMSRAETARAQRDSDGAARWYQKALVLQPRSTAAMIALSSLKPSGPLPFDALDSDDLYYRYPCTVLTAGIDSALSKRVLSVVLK